MNWHHVTIALWVAGVPLAGYLLLRAVGAVVGRTAWQVLTGLWWTLGAVIYLAMFASVGAVVVAVPVAWLAPGWPAATWIGAAAGAIIGAVACFVLSRREAESTN